MKTSDAHNAALGEIRSAERAIETFDCSRLYEVDGTRNEAAQSELDRLRAYLNRAWVRELELAEHS